MVINENDGVLSAKRAEAKRPLKITISVYLYYDQ